jgi:tRNA (guanine37-N1)-methyltransferase
MWFGLVSLFPEMFSAITEQGVIGRAAKAGTLKFESFNPRDYTQDRHRTVDDRPYGGGPGMLMKVQPLDDAIAQAQAESRRQLGSVAKVVYLSPQGRRLSSALARELASEPGLICIAGRYEGIDERIIQSRVDLEVSIGDYVISGGELSAMVLIDAVARYVPGVLGHEGSASEDSFEEGLLDCPHYTRPEEVNGMSVPGVLLSGDHERIRRWRMKESLGRTYLRRPDLLANVSLSPEQKALLDEFLKEVNR